mgnify:CR=1 FL=1
MTSVSIYVSAIASILLVTANFAGAQTDQDTFVLESLGRAIDARPDEAAPRVKRGMYYLWRTFEYGKALEDFDKALELDPNNVVAYVGRADVHTGRDSRFYDPRKALEDTNKAIELDPKSSDAYRMRGDLPGHPGFADFGNAFEDYKKALELNPENMLAHLGLAYNHAKQGTEFHNFNKALEYARKAAELAPNESLAIEALGDLLASKPETLDEGLQFLNRAVQLNRRNSGSLIARGYLFLIRAMDEEIVDIFGALKDQNLSLADIVNGNDRAFERALRKLGKNGLLSRALRDFKEAERLCPHNDDVFKAQAFAVQNFPGQERRALNFYTRAAELNKFSADNYIDRVEFLLEHPELAISPKDLPEAAEEGLDPAILAELIAKSLPELTKELVEDCDKALAIEPDSDTAYYLRGSLFATQGKYKDAIANLDKALEFAPLKAEYYEARADVHQTFGRDEEAQADLERATELNEID